MEQAHVALQGDLFKFEITKYLPLKELIKLKRVSNYYNNYFNKPYLDDYIGKMITQRLKGIFGDYWEEFAEVLGKTGALISGSFIIQCILNENWNTDIDIYLSNDRSASLEQWLCNQAFLDYGTPAHMYEGLGTNEIVGIIDYAFIEKDAIEQYKKMRASTARISQLDLDAMRDLNRPKIQLIKVNTPDIFSFISADFDFDICKNCYSLTNNTPSVNIIALNSIINYSTYFKFKLNANNGMTLQRYLKYCDRGFEFKNLQAVPTQETIDKFSNSSIITIRSDNVSLLEPLTNTYKYVSGNFNYFSNKLNCPYFFIFNDKIIFNKEQLALFDHTNCEVCNIMRQVTSNQQIFHISFASSFMCLNYEFKPLELIFVVASS